MPVSIWNLEWLNANSQRRYPLADDATGSDTTGSFQLPTSFIVELDLPVHAGMNVDPSRFFVMSLGIYTTGVLVTVGYQPAVGDAVQVANAMVTRANFTPNTMFALGGVGDFSDTVGKIVIGSFDALDEQPAGQFEFELAATTLDPDAVRPLLRGVSSIAVVNGADVSERMYGDIELVAGNNIQLTPDLSDPDNPRIIVSAIDSTGFEEPCVCVSDDAPAIRRINGVAPTADGDFTLLGNNCLSITPIANGLKLADECSQPCCGCQELEAITRDLELFGTQFATLEGFLQRLETSSRGMDQVVLGSKLNDASCANCGE